MVQFDNPAWLLSYLKGKDNTSFTFNKVSIRKDSGYVLISTNAEELCISLQLNTDSEQSFTSEDLVDLIMSLEG